MDGSTRRRFVGVFSWLCVIQLVYIYITPNLIPLLLFLPLPFVAVELGAVVRWETWFRGNGGDGR